MRLAERPAHSPRAGDPRGRVSLQGQDDGLHRAAGGCCRPPYTSLSRWIWGACSHSKTGLCRPRACSPPSAPRLGRSLPILCRYLASRARPCRPPLLLGSEKVCARRPSLGLASVGLSGQGLAPWHWCHRAVRGSQSAHWPSPVSCLLSLSLDTQRLPASTCTAHAGTLCCRWSIGNKKLKRPRQWLKLWLVVLLFKMGWCVVLFWTSTKGAWLLSFGSALGPEACCKMAACPGRPWAPRREAHLSRELRLTHSCSTVLVSAVQQSESAVDVHIYMYIPKEIYILKQASKIAVLYKWTLFLILETRFTVTKGRGEQRIDEEIGTGISTLLHVKQMTNRDLP